MTWGEIVPSLNEDRCFPTDESSDDIIDIIEIGPSFDENIYI